MSDEHGTPGEQQDETTRTRTETEVETTHETTNPGDGGEGGSDTTGDEASGESQD